MSRWRGFVGPKNAVWITWLLDHDVRLFARKRTNQNNMDSHAIPKKVNRGGRYCVAGGPGSTSCTNTSYTHGIKMHQFPKDEAVRQKWVKFIERHRPTFKTQQVLFLMFCTVWRYLLLSASNTFNWSVLEREFDQRIRSNSWFRTSTFA